MIGKPASHARHTHLRRRTVALVAVAVLVTLAVAVSMGAYMVTSGSAATAPGRNTVRLRTVASLAPAVRNDVVRIIRLPLMATAFERPARDTRTPCE